MRRRDQEAGVSVLELLVALSLLTVIAVTLATTLGLGVRTWERGQTFPAEDEMIALRGKLRHWLETTKPPTRPVGLPQAFQATSQRLSFLTSDAPHGLPANTETRVIVDILEFESGSDLVLTLEAVDAQGNVVISERRRIHRSNVPLRLRYFRPAVGDEPAVWIDRWDAPRVLPGLISIEAVEQTHDWPPLIVSPKLR